jgi:hypothetical protein
VAVTVGGSRLGQPETFGRSAILKPVLAGECEGPIGALGLRDSENSMRSGVVYRDGALIVDRQPPGLGKNCVSQIVLRADRAGPPNPGGDRLGER